MVTFVQVSIKQTYLLNYCYENVDIYCNEGLQQYQAEIEILKFISQKYFH